MSGCTLEKNLQDKTSQQYKNGRFKNTQTEYDTGNSSSFISNVWALFTDKTENKIPQPNTIPIVKLSKENIENMPNNSVVRLVHSTLLFKIDNQYILTDPVFSQTITPFPLVAPKRFHEMPISIEELPFIHKVIISHNHYDHLDKPSIKKLKDKVGHFYTTLGVKQNLLDMGVDTMKVCELDWWQSCTNKSLQIVATPAQHFSGRSLFDRNKTLWASWVIKGNETSVYFSADTGYFNTFKKIAQKYGPFDMTFLEAGAYNERWKEVHMMPEQTIQAHKDLNAKTLFPIHNSSFKLSLHAWNEPLQSVVQLANENSMNITHPKMGEIIDIMNPTPTSKWWK